MQKLNFLMPIGSEVATKTFEFKDDAWNLKKNYKAGKYFKGFEIPVSNIDEAYELIKENQKYPVFMIHGGFIEGIDKNKMVRRRRKDNKDGRKPTIVDRYVNLFCLDVDGYVFPDIIESALSGTHQVEWFIQNNLPEPFKHADYIYQYSSSYGLTTHNLKVHIWFWLKEPANNMEIREWIIGYNDHKKWKNIIDPSVLLATQPVYIQRRICEGGFDPIDDFIGIVKKEGALDWAPEKTKVYDVSKPSTPNNKRASDYDLKAGVEKILTATNYHEELNKLALSLINRRVPPNTVKEMLEGAMNSAEVKDQRWHERYDDIGRSVDSAVNIVNNPTLDEVLAWIYDEDTMTVKAEFATRVLGLSPMDRTTAIAQIVKKIGFGVADVKKTIKMAEEEELERRKEAARKQKSDERETMGIHEIECSATNSGEVAKMSGDILALSEKKPEVYAMGGSLASVGIGHPKTIRQVSKLSELGADYPKMPIIIPYRKPFYSLGGRMEKDIVFINESGADIECPTRVLHMVGEAVNNSFKPLTGIVEHPFVDSHWKVVQKEGYNEKTGLYTLLHRKLKLTKMDATEAYNYLAYTVFDEFPFNSDLDRCVAVSSLLTAVQRPTIAGDTGMPGFGIVSPIQSSGKTTLAQLISYAIYNRPVGASSWSNDDEELSKHILAILQEGHSCVLFDNINQGATIQSSVLANAMSNDIFSGRQLGENKTIEVPSSVIWLFTGNGIKFVGDFATRIYPITINPDMEDPNTRIFKRENVGQWAMENRKKIISAVISIIMDGKDMDPIEGSTRFKLWDKFVRRPLYKVANIDVNEVVKKNQKDDPIKVAKTLLLETLKDTFKEQTFTTKDIVNVAFANFGGESTELGESIADLLGEKGKKSVSLGRYLSSIVDVVMGGLVLKKNESNVVKWHIVVKEDEL